MKMKTSEVKNIVEKFSTILSLKDVKVEVDDFSYLKVWGFSGKAENTIYLHKFQTSIEDLNDTICHEMCHLKAERHGHGVEWQNLMNLCREREVIK